MITVTSTAGDTNGDAGFKLKRALVSTSCLIVFICNGQSSCTLKCLDPHSLQDRSEWIVSIVHDVKGTREFAKQLVFNRPWIGVHRPCNKCVLLHPFIEPSFASMGQCNSSSATYPPQRKPAFLFKQHTKRPTERRALGVSSVMLSDAA